MIDSTFVLANWQWLGLGGVVVLGLLLELMVRLLISRQILKLLAKYKLESASIKKIRLARPLGVMVFSTFWILAIGTLSLPTHIHVLLHRLGAIALTVSAVISIHHFVDPIFLYFQKLADRSENKFDDILVPLVRKTVKFFVVVIGLVFIGDSLTLNMKNILAGLGIGGIALALAAKDTISNLFGSFTVLLDRPFAIGDWVVIGEGEGKTEGIIEEVGLRSTRIRTFYDSQVSIPNGQLTNLKLDNFGRRQYRRLSTNLALEYSTSPEKIEAFCQGIRQLILDDKWTRKDQFQVHLSELADSSLHIMLYVFWEVPDWPRELSSRHRLLMGIIKLAEKLKIEFAFPTQTIHLAKNSTDNADKNGR